MRSLYYYFLQLHVSLQLSQNRKLKPSFKNLVLCSWLCLCVDIYKEVWKDGHINIKNKKKNLVIMTQSFEGQLLPVTKLPLAMPVQPFQYTGLQTAHLDG